MKISIILNVVFAAVLAVLLLKPGIITEGRGSDKEVTTMELKENNEIISVIHSRKSVRHFTGAAVTQEQLDTLIRAGMAAPTARDLRPWAFIGITDRAVLDALQEQLPYAKMLDKAGAAVIVCGIPSEGVPGRPGYWVQDCAAATQNILLAAESMGLGAVWTGVHPNDDRENLVRKIVNLPDSVVPLNVIPIGYPTGVDKPKDKYNPEKIHWQRW
jgi:nitroreductase